MWTDNFNNSIALKTPELTVGLSLKVYKLSVKISSHSKQKGFLLLELTVAIYWPDATISCTAFQQQCGTNTELTEPHIKLGAKHQRCVDTACNS